MDFETKKDKKVEQGKENEQEKSPELKAEVAEKKIDAGKFEADLDAKYNEIVGKDGSKSFTREGLYRDMIRKQFKKIKWITLESEAALKNVYKRMGEVESLGAVKDNFDKYSEGEFAGIDKIPVEAINIERDALKGINLVEDGFISPLAFQKYLDGELSNEGMKKLAKGPMALKSIENNKKPGLEAMNESANQSMLDTFDRIGEWQQDKIGELPTDARNLKERINYLKSINPELSGKEIFENIKGADESLLRKQLVSFKNMGKNPEEVDQEKMKAKAELLGMSV